MSGRTGGTHRGRREPPHQALGRLVKCGDRVGVERLLADEGLALVAQGHAAAVISAAGEVDPQSADPRVLTVLLGRAHQARGDWVLARTCLRAAAGTGPLDPTIALWLGQLEYLTGHTDRALEAYDRARGVEVGSAGWIQLVCETAIWLRAAGQDQQARAAADSGAEAAGRSADPATLAHSHRVLALLATHDGDRPASDLHHQRAIRLAEELGDDLLRLGLLINRSSYLAEEGSPAEALETVAAALRLGTQLEMVAYQTLCRSIRGRANARLGRFDDALADIDAAQGRWQEIGPSVDTPFGLLVRGDVHRRRGEPSQAQAVLEEALRTTPDTAGWQPLRAVALATLARARAADDLPAARELAEQAVPLATGTGRVPALLASGWIALLGGDRDTARVRASEARQAAGVRRDRAGLAEALELTALSAPQPAALAGLLEEAATLWRQLDDPVGVARVRLVAARLAGPSAQPAAEAAKAELLAYGVRLGSGAADSLAVAVGEPPIVVKTLGDFRVLRAGAQIPVGDRRSNQVRTLLQILVAQRGRRLNRDQLMELLWPNEPVDDDTANRLSVLLSTLRRTLDPDVVLAEGGTVALNGSVVASDLDAFLTIADAALDADRREESDAPRLLRAAEAAYTGEFLPGSIYEEWSQAAREGVRNTHIRILRALLRHAGNLDEREQYLLQLLRYDPYDEPSHCELIRLLRNAGRHGEARRRYEIYLKSMAEIGVTPDALLDG